jgi:hypothetical protein
LEFASFRLHLTWTIVCRTPVFSDFNLNQTFVVWFQGFRTSSIHTPVDHLLVLQSSLLLWLYLSSFSLCPNLFNCILLLVLLGPPFLSTISSLLFFCVSISLSHDLPFFLLYPPSFLVWLLFFILYLAFIIFCSDLIFLLMPPLF